MCDILNEIIVGVLSGIISPIILYGGKIMITKPRLKMSKGYWKEGKWVGFEKNKAHGSTSMNTEVVCDGYAFTIYGIKIENEHQKLIVRDPAEITSTTIQVFDKDGNQIILTRECRWWSHDLSELDNLFVSTDKIDITSRRNQIISDGESRSLAIYFELDAPSGHFKLFAIDSDRKSKFFSGENRFKGQPPYYAKLFINGKNFHKEFNLQIMDENLSPLLNEIENFPFFDKE